MSKKKSKKVAEGGGEQDEQKVEKKEKEQKQGGGDGGMKEGNGGDAVLLKLDLHCEGCASKVVKIVKGFGGVESVKIDGASGKCAVTGKVDPVKLRDKIEQKTHKKVELLSPIPKKDKENAKNKDDSGDGKEEKKKKDKDNKSKEKKSNDSKKKNKDDEKSCCKELPVTSVTLKVPLHCEGCIQKIYKIVSKTKGYEEIKFDKQKDMVMVKGAMDMKALAETLKKHLKRDVELVQPKKDEKKEKEKEKGSGDKGKGGGEGKAGGGGQDGGAFMDEGNRMQVQQFNYGYGYPSPSPYNTYAPPYVPSYAGGGVGDPYYQQLSYHAPQMFSDENPNACSIM